MKNLFLILCAFQVWSLNAKRIELNLQNAIKRNYVKASASSLGKFQGECMNLQILNLSKDSLLILVEAGRRLNSLDDSQQDILIVKEERIFLKKHEGKSVHVKGYCCQSSNRAPELNAKYDINTLADSELVCLARFLNKNCFSTEAEQHAIWAISDKKPIASIPHQNDTFNLSLRRIVAQLKGEELPWYTLINNTFISTRGNIQTISTHLVASLKYSNDKEEYATLYIYDASGHMACLIKSEWLKQGNNLDYALNLPIKNLVKGKYHVVLQTKEKELLKRSFEI